MQVVFQILGVSRWRLAAKSQNLGTCTVFGTTAKRSQMVLADDSSWLASRYWKYTVAPDHRLLVLEQLVPELQLAATKLV